MKAKEGGCKQRGTMTHMRRLPLGSRVTLTKLGDSQA